MHIYQRQVFETFDKELTRFFILEWARRHRKTTLALNLLIREAAYHPNSKYVYVAPTQIMARNIVWDDPNMLSMALPPKAELDYTLNDTKMLIKFPTRNSMIKFGGSDNPDAIRGIDAVGAVFDEWALIKENTWTEIFRPIIAGPHIANLLRWAMWLYTPKGINHATQMFDAACCLDAGGAIPDCGVSRLLKKNWFASRLDGEQAGIMTQEELKLAKEDMPQAFYDQEIKCSRVTEEEMTVITSAMLHALTLVAWDIVRKLADTHYRIVSIDPAFGGDMCVLTGLDNTRIMAKKRINPQMTNEIILAAKKMADEIGTKNFIVDTIGWGKGVNDGLIDDVAGYDVQTFNSSSKPLNQELYANKKAEAYHYTAKQIKKQKVEAIYDKELLRQLPIAARFKVSRNGKMIMQLKDKIKETLGCSPDDADSYVMGIYGAQFVEPEVGKPQMYGEDEEDELQRIMEMAA